MSGCINHTIIDNFVIREYGAMGHVYIADDKSIYGSYFCCIGVFSKCHEYQLTFTVNNDKKYKVIPLPDDIG